MDSKKKNRAKNFLDCEKQLLVDIIREKYSEIVENKSTDAVTSSQKSAAWKHITAEYNSQAQTGSRNSKQLHTLYDILKKVARRNLNLDKNPLLHKESYPKTAAGTFTTITVFDEKLIESFKEEFDPLDNAFDSSASYVDAAESSDTTQSQHPSELLTDAKSPQSPQSPSNTAPSTCWSTHGSVSVPVKRNRPSDRWADRFIARKKLKRTINNELKEKRITILQIEEEIKRTQLKTAQVELTIKEAELKYKRLLYRNID